MQVTDVARLWISSSQTKLALPFCEHLRQSVSYTVFDIVDSFFLQITYLLSFSLRSIDESHNMMYNTMYNTRVQWLFCLVVSLSNKSVFILLFINYHCFLNWIESIERILLHCYICGYRLLVNE